MLFNSVKIACTLLLLAGLSPLWATEIEDIEASFQIRSNFIVRVEAGPLAEKFGINKFAPSRLLSFKGKKYNREITFSDDGRYITIRDFYGEYKLLTFQTINLEKYISFRRGIAFVESWKDDLRSHFSRDSKGDDRSTVQIDIPWDAPSFFKPIIGEGKSNIRVTGSRSITFSGRSEWEEGLVNTGTFKQSKFPTLHMEQKSRFRVTGTIGSKITVEVDQDSQRNTELANTIKLRYNGEEDEILQTIEAGNTNLALPNAQLIGYSQNIQGLFGIKSTAKIGNLDLTVIASQEKGSSEKASFTAGARETPQQIRDYQYLGNTYFSLGLHGYNDSLISVELYTLGDAQEDPYGLACVNPDSLPQVTEDERIRDEVAHRPFRPMDQSQFEIYRQAWLVVLDQQLPDAEVLGAYIRFERWNDSTNVDTLTIGNLNYHPAPGTQHDTTLVLRLLKHHNPDSSFTTWDLMWRNVYDLGARNISPDGFELRIYKGTGGQAGLINDRDDQEGECFITILGLDERNNNTGELGSDCIFDFDNTVLDAAKGHLIFPDLTPFNSADLNERVPEVYNVPRGHNSAINASKYYIYVKTAQRASAFSLGRANIIEGSEVVKLGDGTILRRGVDYNINYDIGQLTFLTDEALNPAANVSVDFEYAPFFMPEKKSLFGMAGQYNLFENSNISLAAMFRSETITDPRPRVGREPRRGFIWDSNFSFNFQPEVMTSLVDALPLVEADAGSALNISGEIAQSFPNPNIRNEGFIDDFEGTRNYTDLSNRRGLWTRCSPPLAPDGTRLDSTLKVPLWWYNQYDPVRITEIWPEREVRAQDDRHDVLDLEFFPDSAPENLEFTWAGIMRPLYAGLADQSQSKFIELWYLPDHNSPSGDPTLYLNLGLISEDLDNDNLLDTEDRLNDRQDGVFQPEEDTGLDGLFDANEPGSDSIPDPNGDNWYYDNNNPNDYSHINGTEGNRNDPDRLGRFDTEDINNNGSLDKQNGYYEYVISLNDPKFWADSTSTGWQLVRIPLQDSTVFEIKGAEGSADFSRINFVRMWLSGATEPYHLRIALFQFVGNKWEEMNIASIDPSEYPLGTDEKFEITVKNTHENLSYDPPPGVAGKLDRETGIREKEQSLVMSYQNMGAGHVARAFWNLYQPEDYTHYQRLKMYVHGDSTADSGRMKFFFRMGQDSSNFYEYHTILERGWSENNAVDIDFVEITQLKYELQERLKWDTLAVADTTDGNYRVRGNPSLSQIKRFAVGLEIDSSAADLGESYTGEIWLDELRVTDVRKKSDFAGRMQVTARFSDFVDVNITYGRTGADFFPLSAKFPSGATSTSKSARINTKVDRFFPPSLGLSLPVSYSWQNSLSLPRLKPGSDIILEDQARRVERSENTTRSYNFSQSFNRNTKNPIWNLTLNRIRTSYTHSKTTGISPAIPESDQARYKASGSYDLTPRAKPTLKPFFWTKYLFLPGSFYNSRLFYLPTKLNFSSDINGMNSRSLNRQGITTQSRTKDLSLNTSTGFGLFSTLRSNYSLNSTRDISDPKRFKLSINPSKMKLGQEQTFQQRFDVNFQPKIMKLFDNKFSFNSSFNENSDFKRNPDSTRTTQMQNAFKIELTFKLQELFPRRGPGRTPQKPHRGRGEKDDDEESLEDYEEESKRKMISPRDIFTGVIGLFKSIKPIRGSYQKDKKLTRQGLLERPSWKYKFGFSEDPQARSKVTTGRISPNQSNFSDTYRLDSGLQPFKSLDVGISYGRRKTLSRSSADPTFSTSITFPDLTASLSGLEKLALFNRFARTVVYQFAFSKKVDESGHGDTQELYKRDMTKRYTPLVGLNFNFLNNVRANIRYDKSSNKSENLRTQGQADRTVFGSDNNLKVSFSYSLTAPKGLKLPFLKRVKFNSQLSVSLDVSIANNKTESITGGARTTDSHRKDIRIEPKMSYQFSRAITGGLRAVWNDSEDKIQQRKHHVRELGIWTEIRF